MPAPKDPAKREAWRKRISESQRGRKHSPESNAKRRATMMGKNKGRPRPDVRGDLNPMRRPEVAAKFRGPNNNRYTEAPGYFGVHDRLKAERGLASDQPCEVCGEPAKHWALSHEAPLIEINNRGQTYSIQVDDYIAMCVRCHRRYDRGTLSL